jgi:hypothetical protein
LINKIDAFPSYPGVAESFRSLNLLWAIDLSGHSNSVAVTDLIRYLLQTVLPPSLVSHAVLSAIQKSIPQNEAHFYLDPFPDQQLLAAWKMFNGMATAHNVVYQAYTRGGYRSIKGCDNMEVCVSTSWTSCLIIIHIPVRTAVPAENQPLFVLPSGKLLLHRMSGRGLA